MRRVMAPSTPLDVPGAQVGFIKNLSYMHDRGMHDRGPVPFHFNSEFL